MQIPIPPIEEQIWIIATIENLLLSFIENYKGRRKHYMKNNAMYICVIFLFSVMISVKASGANSLIDVLCDGNYIDGVIYSNSIEGWDWTEIQTYKFSTVEPGDIDIHFITHTENDIKIQVKDSDENVLKDDTVWRGSSPIDFHLSRPAGDYYIYILINSNTTEGDYRFKIDFAPHPISSSNITLGNEYKGLFESKAKSDQEIQQSGLYLEKKGEYVISLKSDMYIECNFKNEDEETLQTIRSYSDDPVKETIELPDGNIIVEFCSYGDPGFYNLTITPKDQPQIGDQNHESGNEETQDNENEKGIISMLNKLLSPSTFFGYVVGGIIVGVAVAIFKGKDKSE